MRKVFVLFLALLPLTGFAQFPGAGERQPIPDGLAITLESGGGLLGGLVIGGGLALAGAYAFKYETPGGGSGLEDAGYLLGAFFGAAVGYPLGCGAGAWGIGKACGDDGNLVAVLGASCGTTLLGGLLAVGGQFIHPAVSLLGYGVMGLGTPVVAGVVTHSTGRSSDGARLQPGSLALRPVRDVDGSVHTAMDFRLLNVRF